MTTRKNFIAATSLLAIAPAAVRAAAPQAKRTPLPDLRFSFDAGRFNAILAKPALHRQCFGAKDLAQGSVLEGMNNTIRAYEDYLGEEPASLHVAAVFYHGPSVFMALNDSAWNELVTPFIKSAPAHPHADQFAGVATGQGNPFLRSASSDPHDVSVDRLVSKGASFFVCHNALDGYSYVLAQSAKSTYERVHAQLLRSIVPGALVVPAGVMAINACQEAHFTYIAA